MRSQGFSAQIREATDPVMHETLVCDFSTTTPAIRTASEVALMDSFSSYFTYFIDCICGKCDGSPDRSVDRAADSRAEYHAGLSVLVWFAFPHPGRAYSVLTHEAIIDAVWLDAMNLCEGS